MAYIPMTHNLGFPKLDEAKPASTAAGRSSPWKLGDIIRVTKDNTGTNFEAIYLQGASGVTAGGQVTYNPTTLAVTNGAGTPSDTAISATALSAANSTSLYGWFRIGRRTSVPPAGVP